MSFVNYVTSLGPYDSNGDMSQGIIRFFTIYAVMRRQRRL